MIDQSDVDRFLKRVTIDGDNEKIDCWNYDGCTIPKGYHPFSWDCRQSYAHRFSYIIYNNNFKEPPKGLYVCHTCDVPGCVNPNHLFLGTAIENNLDMKNKGRINPAKGDQIHTVKLWAQDVIDIITGVYLNVEHVCAELNITDNVVYKILRGDIWKDITKYYDLEKANKQLLFNPWNRPSNVVDIGIVKLIKIRLAQYHSPTVIAKDFNINRNIVYSISYGNSWKHVII